MSVWEDFLEEVGQEKALEGGVLKQRIGEVPHGVLESSFGMVDHSFCVIFKFLNPPDSA